MAIIVNSGPITERRTPAEIAKKDWPLLVGAKKYFIEVTVAHDCRSILQFVNEAKEMWRELGYKDLDDMILNGYGLDPNDTKIAYDWLKRFKPDWAVPFEKAVKLGRRGAPVGNQNAVKLGKHGSENKPVNHKFVYGTGNKDYTLARLERDHPDLAKQVRAGKLSANQAAIEAGINTR
jgi:hypothetical protein